MVAAPAAAAELRLVAPAGLPPVTAGTDLAAVVVDAVAAACGALDAGDVVVVAQKVVSKAEGRTVALAGVVPSSRAVALAATCRKDPRLVELVLRESRAVLRAVPGVLIVEHRLGHVMANAGIDQSNVDGGEATALLLPEDPDASAAALRAALEGRFGVPVGVVVSDSFGRAWRLGTVGTAIGVSGLAAALDLRGRPDLFGRPLLSTIVGHADEIAAAASLLMGQGGEGRPVVVVRGLPPAPAATGVAPLLRPPGEDLFR